MPDIALTLKILSHQCGAPDLRADVAPFVPRFTCNAHGAAGKSLRNGGDTTWHPLQGRHSGAAWRASEPRLRERVQGSMTHDQQFLPVVTPGEARTSEIRPARVALFATACGIAVANLYYSQPLVGLIAPAMGLHAGIVGLIVALTQLGYGVGLLCLVPLSDVIENRRLVIWACGAVSIGLLGIALSDSAVLFMISSFAVGVAAVATQILVPFASQLAPQASRGRVVGNVMAGLLVGVMLARPLSSYIAAVFGWRSVFYIAAGMMLALMMVLRGALPQRLPRSHLTYAQIMRSLGGLVTRTPLLRRRAFYQGMMFAGFNLFWTGLPLLLMHEFGLGQRGIALFTLAGAAGALSAPIAGRLADGGLTRPATGWAMLAALLAFVIAMQAGRMHSLAFLMIAALMLDAAVQICQVLSLRSLYMLAPQLRGRLNGLFMSFVFACGATASALAAAVYVFRGWGTLATLGGLFIVAALARYVVELRREVAGPTLSAQEINRALETRHTSSGPAARYDRAHRRRASIEIERSAVRRG
jgi:predicted MFS family arabinose efflux permease